MITSWSHSKLGDFSKCKKMTFLKHVARIPEPPRPLPPGKTEHANDRGSRVHDNCEGYVRGDHDSLCPEAEKSFGLQLDLLRVMYAEGLVSLEGEWGMSREWTIAGWNGDWEEISGEGVKELGVEVLGVKALPERGKDAQVVKFGTKHYVWIPSWLRLKLDVMVMFDETHAAVIDYKTGRKFGNEVKHADQVQLYQLVTFLRNPKLLFVTAELWYLDQPEGQNITSQTFTRMQGLRFRDGFDKRGIALTTNTEWPANPNKFNCQWCPYKNTEHCDKGV